MRFTPTRCATLFLSFVLTTSLSAQTSGYHTEYQDFPAGASANVQYIILVNDSSQSIEAYHISQQCMSADHRHTGGNDSGDDALSIGSGNTGNVYGANGSRPSKTNAVPPGGRWDTFAVTQPFSTLQTCDTQITVLYSDGSYEGSEAALRGIKASRDGIADGVRYWNDHLREANETGKASDGGTLLAFAQVVKRRLAQDETMQKQYRINSLDWDATPLLLRYWSGRLRVDREIAGHFPSDQVLSNDALVSPLDITSIAGHFHTVSYFADAWQQKIDRDAAMTALNLRYPPISDPTETQQTSGSAPSLP